jgi:hypothetical protein
MSGHNDAPAVMVIAAAALALIGSLFVPKLGGQIRAGFRKAL